MLVRHLEPELAAAQMLVEAGAAVNGVPMPVGKHLKSTALPLEAPLHSAARLPWARAQPMIEMLLQAGADAEALDQVGRSALDVTLQHQADADPSQRAAAADVFCSARPRRLGHTVGGQDPAAHALER